MFMRFLNLTVFFFFRFPVNAQAGQGSQGSEGCVPPQPTPAQVHNWFSVPFSKIITNSFVVTITPFIQDGKLAPYMTRPSPPSFGQGFTSKLFIYLFFRQCQHFLIRFIQLNGFVSFLR